MVYPEGFIGPVPVGATVAGGAGGGSGVKIPIAGLLNFAMQLGAIASEFVSMEQSTDAVTAAIDMPWMDGTMQHASSDFEGKWNHKRAELLEKLNNYLETVLGVVERWAGYDESMGSSFMDFLQNTPEGRARLREIQSQSDNGGALWPGTQEKAIVDEQTQQLIDRIEQMSPEELQAYMHDNDIPLDPNDPGSVPPHPDDDPLFSNPEPPQDAEVGTLPPTPQYEPYPESNAYPGTGPAESNVAPTPPTPTYEPYPESNAYPGTAEPHVAPTPETPTYEPYPESNAHPGTSFPDLEPQEPTSPWASGDPSDQPQIIPPKSEGDFGNLNNPGSVVADLIDLAERFGISTDFGSAFTGQGPSVDWLIALYNEHAPAHGLPSLNAADANAIHELLATQR